MSDSEDRWADWFLHPGLESGGERYAAVMRTLGPIRDRVVANAGVREGSVAVDIGSGSGLIAFAIAERVGDAGHVTFVDISKEMLDHCRRSAAERGLQDRCSFIETSVLDLGAIPDASVDAVTVRSVLIYVADRERALAEIHRVLRPGGRLSLYEPAIGHHAAGGSDASSRATVESIEEMLSPLLERNSDDGKKNASRIMELDERELLASAERCGFTSISLSLEIEMARGVYFTCAPSNDAAQQNQQKPEAKQVIHRTAGIYLRAIK